MSPVETTENTPAPACDLSGLAPAVEAALLCMEKAVPASRLAQLLNLEPDQSGLIDEAVGTLNEAYDATGRSFRIERVAGGLRVMTRPEHAGVIASVRGSQNDGKLSRAAVETLAIVAFRQPVTRAEIEAIRGVSSGEMLRSLLEKRMVDITGRAEEPGRPILYGTTRAFLEAFGLASLRDLPRPEELGAEDEG